MEHFKKLLNVLIELRCCKIALAINTVIQALDLDVLYVIYFLYLSLFK